MMVEHSSARLVYEHAPFDIATNTIVRSINNQACIDIYGPSDMGLYNDQTGSATSLKHDYANGMNKVISIGQTLT
jgi:hypothetical protein